MTGPVHPGRHGIGTRARLYQTLRTAHLEQALDLAPATILYRDRRYDFDETLAARLDLVRAGPLRVAAILARSAVIEFEINEPLMRYGIRGTAIAVAALQLRAALGGARATVVTYCIENLDPFAPAANATLRRRLSAVLDRALTRYVWRRVDRVVFGTAASGDLYRRVLPRRAGRSETLIPTLPQPCGCTPAPREHDRVTFLGAFSDRKGFSLLVDAWPLVIEHRPDATLTLLGKGPLEHVAREWAARDSSVDLHVDPPRDEIHRQLRRTRVLTLPSQPAPTWREQLGLPTTEALAHGCTIVSTDETGIAQWLESHGHTVIDAPSTADALAAAILSSLAAPLPPDDVLASLPHRDGRLQADDWLFTPPAADPRPPAAAPA